MGHVHSPLSQSRNSWACWGIGASRASLFSSAGALSFPPRRASLNSSYSSVGALRFPPRVSAMTKSACRGWRDTDCYLVQLRCKGGGGQCAHAHQAHELLGCNQHAQGATSRLTFDNTH
jgi:hypothetical protein